MSASKHDITAQIVGGLVFLVGIGLLFYVFRTAQALFAAPPPTVIVAPGAPANSALLEIGQSFGVLGRQIVLLLVMCIVGSVMASKGIHLFFAARPAAPPSTPVINGQAPAPAAEPKPAPLPKTKANAP